MIREVGGFRGFRAGLLLECQVNDRSNFCCAPAMKKEEEQVAAKLQQLREQLGRHEILMREHFMKQQGLVSARVTLEASIQALQDFQEARRRNSENHEPFISLACQAMTASSKNSRPQLRG